MRMFQLVKFFLPLSLATILVACAGTTAAPPGARSVGSAAPVCVGGMDCMAKMNAARSWIAANSGLGLIVDSENVLETGGWGMPAYTSVRVERSPIGEGRYWIIANIQCGSSGGQPGLCPDTAAALANFNTTVSAAF